MVTGLGEYLQVTLCSSMMLFEVGLEYNHSHVHRRHDKQDALVFSRGKMGKHTPWKHQFQTLKKGEFPS